LSARPRSRVLNRAREEIVTSRTLRRLIGVAVFAMATAFGAKVAIPLPGTMVPFTLQAVFVLLAGAILGPGLGAASQAAYLAIGALGAPVFAMGGGLGYLLGPTGGYLLAFPAAAFAVGVIAGRSGRALRTLAGLFAGMAIIQLGGMIGLTAVTGNIGQAFSQGVGPFLALGVIKIGLALLVSMRIRPRALELF